MADKTALAKACLSSIPKHFMQYIFLPSKIHNLINRTQRNYIWETTMTKKRMHMVNWDTVTQPKHLGGLGMQKSNIKNETLLCSLSWRLHSNLSFLWANIVTQKYNVHHNRITHAYFRTWKNIQKGWNRCQDVIEWSIYNGQKKMFERIDGSLIFHLSLLLSRVPSPILALP